MDVIDAIHSRRSIRSYQSKSVDRDLIESVIWDAAQAPPPFSGQVPWTFNVIEGVERIAALGARAMEVCIPRGCDFIRFPEKHDHLNAL
jgi:nitroreductase